MIDPLADGDDRTPLGVHKAGVGHGSRVVGHLADPNIKTAEIGIAFRVGAHADLQAGGEDGLAGGGRNFAFVADIGSDEHDAAAVAAGEFGAGDFGSALNHDIAQNSRDICGSEGGGAIGAAGDFEGAE